MSESGRKSIPKGTPDTQKKSESTKKKSSGAKKEDKNTKRARVESKTSSDSSSSDSDTAGRILDIENAVDRNDKIYYKKFRQMEAKQEEIERDLMKTKTTMRAIHRDLVKCDLRIMNVSRKMTNGDPRDPLTAFRTILSEGLGYDMARTDAICDTNSLLRCFWQQQRSRARGGGRGGAANAALENFVLIARIANENVVNGILKDKSKQQFRDFKLGCPKPVGIDRNYTADDKWDRNRAFEVARAYCEKKNLNPKKDVRMKGKAFEVQGVTRTYEQWIVMENLKVDPTKMGEGWVPPEMGPSTSKE